MQDQHGIQQDLLAGVGGPGAVGAVGAVASEREVIAGERGASETAARRAGGPDQDFIGACPDCGSQLAFIEGCATCHVCGFSECG